MTEKYDNILDRLEKHASETPDKQAVAFLSSKDGSVQKAYTYKQLDEETTRIAQVLSSLPKVRKSGDCVLLVYPPSLDFMLAFIACLKAGLVAVPVFPPNPLRPDTLAMFANIVERCQATVALTNREYNHVQQMSKIQQAFAGKFSKKKKITEHKWPSQLNWIVTDNISGGSSNSNGDTKKESKASELTQSRPKSSSICFLQFTSGSTSAPKGVCITNKNLAHNLTCITNELKADSSTVVVSWLPQYHDMGLIGSYLGVLYCGGSGYYLSPLSFLQRPMLWLECVSKYQATHLQAPNFAFKLTARKYKEDGSTESLNLSSVQHIINAAEPVDGYSIDTFYETFGKFGLNKVIYPTYGLAEHTVFVCSGGKQRLSVDKHELEVNHKIVILDDTDNETRTDPSKVKLLVGCGYPAHQKIDVKIVQPEECCELQEDTVGEIWISSPSKAKGYYQQLEETEHDFHAHLADTSDNGDKIGSLDSSSQDNNDSVSKDKSRKDKHSGYLRTGDLGFLHNGELFICGRLKDLIIVGGRNYYPQDIEATAETSTDMVRLGCSAAFTVDLSDDGAEAVALVMELRQVPPSSEISNVCEALAKEIKSAITSEHSLNIANIWFLRPRSVPKTSSGKIARAWCRKGFINNTLNVLHKVSFKNPIDTVAPLEIEPSANNGTLSNVATNDTLSTSRPDVNTIRAMSKKEILSRLTTDVSRVGSIPPDSIGKTTPLVSIMDSLTLSQFKGMLENNYGVQTLSDEYLFRETTTLTKLVEVVKLGHAPDDAGGENNATSTGASVGQAKGLAGALGCPPGVVCVIL